MNVESNINIPLTYNDIFNNGNKDQWLAAVNDEINSLKMNNIWTAIPNPGNVNIVDTKWVF